MVKKKIIESMDLFTAPLFEKSDLIWDHPETQYREKYAAGLLMEWLDQEGFTVTENLGGIPTAFSGRYGSGAPFIGVLGEYDALAGMSQQAGACVKAAQPGTVDGHGCGHNMLGCSSLYACIFLKRYLQQSGKSGTVIFYGCPAEEGGAGKAFLAKAGAFNGLDAALSWHPSDYNAVSTGSSLANIQVCYEFQGISAHASIAPHLGRSALDSVELMNVGCNYLREHIKPDVRVHYAITNSGGNMPGIVQAHAEALYMIRAPHMDDVRAIEDRLDCVARGAALMTGTAVTAHFKKASYNLIPNKVLEQCLYRNMREISVPAASTEQKDFARKIQQSMECMENSLEQFEDLLPAEQRDVFTRYYGRPVNDFLIPYVLTDKVNAYSTDVGDVSWLCPTAQIGTTTWAANSMEHTWQVVSQGKSSLAHAGMLYAAKVLCGAGIDLIDTQRIVAEAKAEWQSCLNGKAYQTLIPDDMTYESMKGE